MNRLFLIFCLWMGISLHAQYSFSSIDEAETEMRNVLKTVEQKTDKGQELCTDARKVMDQVEMQTTDQAAHLGLMTSSLDLLRRRGEAFIRQLPEMEKLGGTIRSAGLEVSKARLQARRQAQSGCERGIKVDEARSQETQKSLLQDIKQALAQVEAQSQLALKAQGPVPAAAKQVDALWSDADQWTKEFSEQGQQLEQVERVLNQISDQLESAEGMQEELDSLIKRLEEDVKKASDILAATQETFQAQAGRSSVIASSLSTIKELYKQAVEAQQKLSSCRSELEQRVSDLEDPIEAVDTDWQNLHDRWNELRNETLDEDGSVAKMQELWLTAKASVSTIDQFLEDIQAAMEMARGCLAQAGASAEAPITFPVPDVVGLSVEDAIRKLEAEGLIPVKIRGSDAPTPEQANTVELQLPQAGKRVGAGEQINIKIYQALPEQLTVPDLMGMSAQEAHQAVEGVGLELSIQAGSYAPSRSEAYTVQEQDPKSGTRVEAGDTVRVRIFASYPDARTVPNLIGLQENEANTLAKQAGLQVQQSKGGEAPSPDKE
ncbi:MAG: PASTA domain-containing protein, partial [Chlamydiia bacterium]|nr:PASTA domain-containing protein [Chlamydiia bacterium]